MAAKESRMVLWTTANWDGGFFLQLILKRGSVQTDSMPDSKN